MYSELRADILAGRRRPGTKLAFGELSARFGASMGVVREALPRLVAEGLVESEPQLGFRVKRLSYDDLRHLTEARCAIETLVLREALEHGGVEWESQLVAAHHRLERTPLTDPEDPDRVSEAWVAAHAQFHRALLSGCPNPRLLAVASSLRDSAELYRRWSVPLGHENRDVAAEHGAMLAAVLAHDADAAVETLAKHIQHTSALLVEGMEAEAPADEATTS